jgi:hypothetical protein
MLYTYSFENRKRDLTDILSTIIKDEPRFISNFRRVGDATAQKHEWLEDQLPVRSVYGIYAGENFIKTTPEECAKISKGMLLKLHCGFPSVYAVENISDNQVELSFVFGRKLEELADKLEHVTFDIVSNPYDITEDHIATQHNCNFTQCFRKDIVLSCSVLAVSVWGNVDNQLNRQTAVALSDLARDLNRVAIFGRRVEKTENTKGEAGGLYAFATGDGALEIDAQSDVINSHLINEASQKVLCAGGEPQQVLCSPGQARIICNKYKDRFQVLRSDDRRGAYVAVIVNDINGRGVTIVADPDMPDTECWVVDPECFGFAGVKGNTCADIDTTPKGFDGIRRTATGEFTFVFKNAKQRCCRIKNIQSSYEVLKGLKTK